ncbi:MAG: phenylacetate--CoA ligase [Fibromonadaceae bacterium]|jgi:phenylacetate-CoA ligase|nr:phenylacetate--CoA ligase [Fibromonadaceae bacterium]
MTNYYEKELETMPRAILEKLQLERLKTTVEYVYKNCNFYSKKMDEAGIKPTDIKSLSDLKNLPFTTKQDLRDNYPFGAFSAQKSDIVRVHASSGTTGKLTVAGYTQNDVDIWATVMARSLAACGCSHSSVINVAYGYGLFTGGLGAHYGSELLGALTIPASSGNSKRQLQLFKDLGVTTLCCTPSYALYLADEMQNEGYSASDFNLKQGVFGAEPWTEEMREQIQNKLGLKAYNIYGLSEIIGPGVSVECEYQCGSHIWEDHFLPEIINPETLEQAGYGQQGELVFTTISKTGMPLIRYRTRDLCSLTNEPCKCGRTHVSMTKVVGRSDDMLIIRGVNVFPSQIESALFTVKGIEPHYQIIVDRVNNLDTTEIQVEIEDKLFSDEVKNLQKLKSQLEKNVSNAISVGVKINFVSRGTIERSQGKAVRVIDKRRI